MVINNRINLTFGSAGSFAGYILLIVGLATINGWAGIILVLIGSFFAFSFTATTIDKEKNRCRQFTQLFGLFKVGDWEELSIYNEIAFRKNESVFRINSLSNRSISSKSNSYLIYLLSEFTKNKIVVKKCKNKEIAKIEAHKLSQFLNFHIVE